MGITALFGALATTWTQRAEAQDQSLTWERVAGGVTFYGMSYASLAGSVGTAIGTGATLYRRPPPVVLTTFGYVFGTLSTVLGATWLGLGIDDARHDDGRSAQVEIILGVGMVGSGASNFVLSGIATSLADAPGEEPPAASDALVAAPLLDGEGRPAGVSLVGAW